MIHASSDVSLRDDKWFRPSTGRLKCNVDAGLFEQRSRIGMGAMVRNHDGVFIDACSRWQFCSILDPTLVEALSFCEALSWLKGMSFIEVKVETSVLVVANAIKNGSFDSSCFGLVISDYVSLIREIPVCQVSFVKRLANHVAYVLTKAFDLMSGLGV